MEEKHAWVNRIVDDKGMERIRHAVVAAEAKTSAEIVPMIVRNSGTHGHVEWLLFLFILICAWMLLPYLSEFAPGLSLLALDLGAFALAFVAALILSRLDRIKRLMTPAFDQALHVDRRAIVEFHASRINETVHATGVLIFVSLLERRAVVLADRAIAEVFPKETWRDVVEKLLAKTRAGDFAGGMCDAIHDIGEKLGPKFPNSPNDTDELDDRLIVKD